MLDATWLVVVLLLNVMVTSVCVVFRTTMQVSSVQLALQSAALVLLLLACFLQQSQQVYVVFGLLRNPLYPTGYSTMEKIAHEKSALNFIGYLYVSVIAFIVPILLTAYLSIFLFVSPAGTSVFTSLPGFLAALITLHAFRLVWQRTKDAHLVFVVVFILELIQPSVSLGWFDSAPLGVKLLTIDVSLDRVFSFIDNLWLMTALNITSYSDKKQRRKYSLYLMLFNFLLFPLPVMMGLMSAIFSSPILPLFTLPIFLLSFPRPGKFWHSSPGSIQASTNQDTPIYQQMSGEIAKAVSKGIGMGSYLHCWWNHPGFYLIRSQNRTAFVQVLEIGYGYVTMSVKGLELQETSCHSLEATRLDDVCDAAFRKNGACLNPYPFLSVLTPIDTVLLPSYSDAENSLTGVIDNPDALTQQHQDFINCIVYLLLKNKVDLFKLVYGKEKVTTPTYTPSSHHSRGKSITSSMFSHDDDVMSPSSRPSTASYMAKNLPGVITDEDEVWDDDGSLPDSGFGLPAMEKPSKVTSVPQKVSSATEQCLPVDDADIQCFSHLFQQQWYFHAKSDIENKHSPQFSSGIEEDEQLKLMRLAALTSYIVVNVNSVPGKNPSLLGPSHLCKLFYGDIPWSPSYDWLEKNQKLHDIVVKAIRYSVKILYDRALMGDVIPSSDEYHQELVEAINDLEQAWYVGTETDNDWKEAIRCQQMSLFTIKKTENGLSSRMLLVRPVEAHVLRINATSVKSIWSDLMLELYYFTNDDEERYSIQAQQSLLRNICIQAADSPLGYAIFSSKPIYKSTLPLAS